MLSLSIASTDLISLEAVVKKTQRNKRLEETRLDNVEIGKVYFCTEGKFENGNEVK
jgi:hypothetical protein